MRIRSVLVAIALLLTASAAAGCDGGPDSGLDHLVIATGEQGDVYSLLGQALAGAARDRLAVDAQVLNTAGSLENLRMVADGRADVGFATVDLVKLAVDGDAPFAGALPLVTLARLYDDYLQIVLRADSGIAQISDLTNLAVSIGAVNSGTDVVVSRVLEAGGHDLPDIDARRLSPARSAEALRSGDISAFFVTGGLPTPAVARLAEQGPIRLLSIPGEVGELQAQFGEYYLVRSVTRGTYGLTDEIATLGIPTVLVVRRDMPDEIAYQLTKLLFAAKQRLVDAHEEARRLDRRSALATFPVTLHPGAVRYYRDAKVMAAPTPAGG
jgi:uncharacterized protein